MESKKNLIHQRQSINNKFLVFDGKKSLNTDSIERALKNEEVIYFKDYLYHLKKFLKEEQSEMNVGEFASIESEIKRIEEHIKKLSKNV